MLIAENIFVRYASRQALNGVSVELREGEIVALLGPNGAGKSTLLRCLNGTVPIESGDVSLDGQPITRMTRREVARRIAVVAQENETKFPVTVLEYVLAGRFAHVTGIGWESQKDIDSAMTALEMCDLSGFSGRLMNELSGGERQRVVLARALTTEAMIMLLDEPTANLDLAHQALMFRTVRERCGNAGASAAVVMHDLNLAAEFADRVVLLSGGEVFASGPPEEVLSQENILAVYGVRTLLDRNPASGKARVTTIF